MNEKQLRFGIISYNIYCNFTNYGSALQSWALSQAISSIPNIFPPKNSSDNLSLCGTCSLSPVYMT